jgi:hypothetical protein
MQSRHRVEEFIAAYNRKDVPGALACFTDDASYQDVTYGTHSGHGELKKMLERMFLDADACCIGRRQEACNIRGNSNNTGMGAAMSAEIIKLPYSVTRGAFSRKPRRSKNGTPEERAAKAPPLATIIDMSRGDARMDGRGKGANPLRSKVIAVSFAASIVGKVVYYRHGFDPSQLDPATKELWLAHLRSAAQEARYIADEMDNAIGRLASDASPLIETPG